MRYVTISVAGEMEHRESNMLLDAIDRCKRDMSRNDIRVDLKEGY